MSDPTSERIEGPTPHGGAYSIAYFSDDEGRTAPKERATQVKIAEFNPEVENFLHHRDIIRGEAP